MLLLAYENSWWGLGPQNISGSRGWLTVLMLANLFTLLLFVCSAGASSLTREKESQSIELLMSTPLTSRDIVWGTLRGLMSFSLPLVAGPTAGLLLFAVADVFRAGPARPALTTPEAVVLLPALFVAFASVIALLSLNLSLNSKTTARALMFSVGVSGIGTALLFGCGSAALQASPLVCAALGELSPIHGIQNIVDFESAFRLQSSSSSPGLSDIRAVRGTRVFGTIVAVAAYCVVAYTQYNAMVRNYDRTLRVQSA
ncbi:MAG: hypothetical protein HZB38_13345 [Planctomycetes bacterium]|nr:hypothetical protein [Planctomycetota bacterium]